MESVPLSIKIQPAKCEQSKATNCILLWCHVKLLHVLLVVFDLLVRFFFKADVLLKHSYSLLHGLQHLNFYLKQRST